MSSENDPASADPEGGAGPRADADAGLKPDADAGPQAGSDPSGDNVVLTRRAFLIGSTALVATGLVAGAAAVLSSQAQSTPLATPPPGVVPTPSGASLEPIESPPAPGPGRVRRENMRNGTDVWELPVHGKGEAEAYASDTSVAPGERIAFAVASSAATAAITLYRLGWYGGRGARPVARWPRVSIPAQPQATTDPVTGLIRAPWTPAVEERVSEGWVSGLYLGVVTPARGAPQYFTFVVRETRPSTPILFISSTTTHQAYNSWGGKSLYPDDSTGSNTISGGTNAVVAGWDRPYASYRGAGLVLRWEYPFVRWLESRGYDVAYAVDVDLERHPELLAGRRLMVFAGHSEYWSVAMRAALEGAIAAGTNVALFSANEIYWRVRFEPRHAGPYRTVSCYRRASIDPDAVSDPTHATTKWREPPSVQPESVLIGQMYGHVVLTPGNFVCTAPDHWIYQGTGMRAGDEILNLIGQEYDRFWPDLGLSPPGTQILAVSPVRPNLGHETVIYGGPAPNEPRDPVHNATIYTAQSGATVFSAGTMQWSWALDAWGSPDWEGVHTPVDPRVARITANILDRLGA
jgi:hypothetical protein